MAESKETLGFATLTQMYRQARTGPAWSALGSGLVRAASENGPDVDSGGRSYRLIVFMAVNQLHPSTGVEDTRQDVGRG